MYKTRSGSRKRSGMTLLEMLAAMSIMSIAGSGIAGLIMLNGMTSNRLSNKVDSLNNARNVIERLGKDIRMARNIGDVFGAVVVDTTAIPPVSITVGSNEFPSASDPKVFTAVGGWPWGFSANTPMTLSTNTLILQVPVFDGLGFPTSIGVGLGNPATVVAQDNVDTIVYRVVPDPDTPNTWMLQVAGFPGLNSQMKLRSNPPQTVLKHIVGPIDPATNMPGPFQYVDRRFPGAMPKKTGDNGGVLNANLTGVVIGFEIKTTDASAQAPATVAIKSEAYMRNNALSTVNSQL
jgi:prepilin-type N-terminal cleavage/methylation domain-containing protein